MNIHEEEIVGSNVVVLSTGRLRRAGRRAPLPATVVLPVRLFLIAGWIRAGAEKLISRQWWNGHELRGFVAASRSTALPFFRPVLEHVISPVAVVVACIVMLTELGSGILVGFGRTIRVAVLWGMLLNVVFMLSGTVNPSIFYLVMEIVLLLAMHDGSVAAGRDSWRATCAVALTSCVAGLAMLPFVRTLHPALVIGDPAAVLAFFGFIVTVTLVARSSTWGSEVTARR